MSKGIHKCLSFDIVWPEKLYVMAVDVYGVAGATA